MIWFIHHLTKTQKNVDKYHPPADDSFLFNLILILIKVFNILIFSLKKFLFGKVASNHLEVLKTKIIVFINIGNISSCF